MSSSSSFDASTVVSSNQSSSDSGISIDENLKLHYEMLSFIYEKQALSKSKLSFVWYQFKKIHDANKTAEELKYIFNCTILGNIKDYDQLGEHQKRYFEVVELLDLDETEKILLNNEPQVGIDYKFIRENEEESTDSELDDTNLEMLIKDNLKNNKTYHGVFEEDLPAEVDDYVLKIKKLSPDVQCKEEHGEMQYELAVIFSALLTTNEERSEGIKKLSQKQIFERLQNNRDLFANSSNYFYDSSNVTDLQDQVSNFDNSSGISVGSLPVIPDYLSSSLDSEQLTTQYFQTSTPLDIQPSTSHDIQPTTSNLDNIYTTKANEPSTSIYTAPKIKTTAALVPTPRHNTRMSKFVESFKSKKRPRRSTLSPPKSN